MAGIFDIAGAGIAGELTNQIGYGIGQLTGYNESRRQDQLKQQQALTDMQAKANLGLMNASFDKQLEMWKNTNAPAQVEQYKLAGLNPALMYSRGGAGGATTGSGGASVGGAQASDETSRQLAQTQSTAMGLQMMKLQSEIDVNNSVAKLNNARAPQAVAETQTTNETRPYLVEQLRQNGAGQWLDNLRKEYENNPESFEESVYKNKATGTTTSFSSEGIFTQQRTTQIMQAEASANNANANALLTNNKAQGYFKELLNDTIRADAAKIQATAEKLAKEWNVGEFTNWKTWADYGADIVKSIIPSAGGIIQKGMVNKVGTGY